MRRLALAAAGALCKASALLAAGALCAASALLAAGAAAGEPGFGPAPRDAEGRFLNLAGPLPGAVAAVVLPFQARRIWANFAGREGAAPRVANDGRFLRENARQSEPTVTWIGHATLLVQLGGLGFLTDPIWSERASPLSWLGPARLQPPGLALEDLPPVAFVVVSHNHYDHLDLPTLRRLARRDPATRFLVPLGNGALLREAGIAGVEELDWGEVRRFGEVAVHCLPAQHWSARGPGDARLALWASWAVVAPERRFYFSGDTGFFEAFARMGRRLGPFDLAALAIGAYRPEAMMRPLHLDPEEAVRAGRELRAERLLGIHFGTFDLADEPLDEPPRRFRAAGAEAGYPADRVWVLDVGETRAF